MTYQEENDKVLQILLDKQFFEEFKQDFHGKQSQILTVELFITTTCPSRCEVCYIVKHGDELYPPEIRDHDTIISNLSKILQWFQDEEFILPSLELFSGDIWDTKLGYAVFDTILSALDNGLKIPYVMIPSNCAFVMNDKSVAIIDEYVKKFKIHQTNLLFSISIDGPLLEADSRPLRDSARNDLRDQAYYDKLFTWAKRHSYGFHPMVSAYCIERWIDNFDWWMMMLKKYHMNLGTYIMMLEVRNDDWTDEKIQHFLKLLDYTFDYFLEHYYHGDKVRMVLDQTKCVDESYLMYMDYSNIGLTPSGERVPCSVSRALIVRLGDLAIVPCHRLSYNKLIHGHFTTNDTTITGIKSKNVQMASRMYAANAKVTHLGCDTCTNKDFCMRGCLGSQYEAEQDPFIPIESVCKLFKAKSDFLIGKYYKTGLLDCVIDPNFDFGKHTKHVNRERLCALRISLQHYINRRMLRG